MVSNLRIPAIVVALVSLVVAAPAPTRAFAQSSSAISGPMSDHLEAATRSEVVETLATDLADGYAYADLGQKMAKLIRGKLADRAYDSITSPEEFARVLKADIRSVVDDQHLNVLFGGESQRVALTGGPELMSVGMRAMNGGIPKVEILPGNIGYLQINGEPPLQAAKGAITTAFAFLQNTDALIIDDRANGGGVPETVALYMSFLSEGAPYTLSTIHDRSGRTQEEKTTDMGPLSYGTKKPVYVLTSVRARSAGEALAYDVQAFKRGLVVGASTAGAANPGDFKPLGHGFTAFVPAAYVTNAVTGGNWEGTGVKPDVAIAPDLALLKAEQLAAEHLRADTTNAALQSAYQALASEASATLVAAAKSAPGESSPTPYASLVGQYRAPNGGSEGVVGVAARDSALYITTARNPEARLIPLGANRFRIDGCPTDFTVFFSSTGNGGMQLTMNAGRWPPFIGKRE
jgi:C-terminal processing protease CtpA/Prc